MRCAILALVVVLGLWGCGGMKVHLTDDTVVRYCQAYKNIRAAIPGMDVRQGGTPTGADLGKLNDAVTRAGFTDYTEFLKVNAAVAWAFGQTTGGAALAQMDKGVTTAVATIDQQLENPLVPEAMKVELRAQKEKLLATQKQGKGWADMAMGLGGALTDEESVAVVKKHAREIQAAYTGF